MNKFLIFLGLALGIVATPMTSFALPLYPSVVEKSLNLGNTRGPSVQLGYQVISGKEQLLKCKYDFALQGGSSAAAINLKAVDGTNCQLPANAVVIAGLIDVLTSPLSNGSATIAVGTGNAANDLKTATAKASFTGKLDVVPVRTAATAIKITAAKNPTMTIATAPLTAGKFNVFIQYLLSD